MGTTEWERERGPKKENTQHRVTEGMGEGGRHAQGDSSDMEGENQEPWVGCVQSLVSHPRGRVRQAVHPQT